MVDGQRKPIVVNDTGLGTTEIVAGALAVVWIVVAGAVAIMLPDAPDGTGALRGLIIALVIVLPLAMLWVAAAVARAAQTQAGDIARLQVAVDGLRASYLSDRQAKTATPTVEAKLDEIAKTARKTETALATFTSSRDPVRKPRLAITSIRAATPDDQPTLALGTSTEDATPPLGNDDFIRALNFPENDKDMPGFDALRRALKDRRARQLVQAAQDVLTLLSEDGIYMDDLNPDRARPELWRRFAQGERGRPMAPLGGIRDRSSLALTAGRMREDAIFRDAAHHFLRLFDRGLVSFEPEASDEELAALSDTRSARAFMLLGRVTGAFD